MISPQQLSQGTIDVWISSFIPADVPSWTVRIAQGTNKGKTALPLPALAKPFNWGKPANTGYLTDQRSFSSRADASARVQSFARLGLYPPRRIIATHGTSGTTEVNVVSGETQLTGKADLSDCVTFDLINISKWRPGDDLGDDLEDLASRLEDLAQSGPYIFRFPDNDRDPILSWLLARASSGWRWRDADKPTWPEPYAMMMRFKASASDPLVRRAANLDYDVRFIIELDMANSRILVGVFGWIDSFPAFESYVRFNGITKTLFTVSPKSAATTADLLGGPFDLIGDARDAVEGAAVFS